MFGRLTKEQIKLRKRVLEVSWQRKFSHLGSCLSAIDLIDGVYQVKKRGEKFVLSNGHAAIAWYVVLEKYGYIKDLNNLKLNVHPDRNPKIDIHVSTGSLGHGLPIAVGLALADKNSNVYCMVSDGECSEGSIWESFRIASELKLYNLKIIVNANGWGAYDPINLIKLRKRIKAFDFKIYTTNGHNPKSIIKALKIKSNNKPVILFAKTKVGQFPFLQGQDAHYYLLNEDTYTQAMHLLK